MIRRVAAPLVQPHEAAAVAWAAMLLPIAFVYRIRANQEYPLLVLVLVALYATERSRAGAGWIFVTAAAAVALFLVKGIFVVFVPVLCALWLLLVRRDSRESTAWPWAGIVLSVVAVALAATGYEVLYRRMAGDSFFSYYIEQRLGSNTGLNADAVPRVTDRLSNVLWYGARVIWFATPGSLILVLAAFRRGRSTARLSPALAYCLAVAAVYVTVMSLGSNRADRFVFPAYFSIGVGGAVVAMRRWARVEQAARWIERREPYGTPLLWFVLFMLTFLTASRLPYVQFSTVVGAG
jgi:4-amino-4-deoxy-L-arabinose transferase-like glycosyltransferase